MLIRDMWQANPTWGAPRIVGELRKLGIDVAKSTVETYRVRPQKPPSPTWKAFLNNHIRDVVALDFFVVPTVTHKVLFVLVMLAHERRRLVRFHVTEHPTAEWTAQQVIDAFPVGRGPAVSVTRSRPRLWRLLSAAGTAYGNGGGRDRSPESVAEPLRRTADRKYPPRMPGPRDGPARAPSDAAPDRVRPVLPSLAHAPGAGDGLSYTAGGPTAGTWTDLGSPRGGWVASSLRAASGMITRVPTCRLMVATGSRDPQRSVAPVRFQSTPRCGILDSTRKIPDSPGFSGKILTY